MSRPSRLLVTGGAGFIGTNACDHFLGRGAELTVIDNLSRPGARENLEWLRGRGAFQFEQIDLRDWAKVRAFFAAQKPFDAALHLAGQVAVTTSVKDPRSDFEINALGTFNLLEGLREHSRDAAIVFSSTNKVYGELPNVAVRELAKRYVLTDRPQGISEAENLSFHSPYGCSKGAADQYVVDYARIYGMRTVSFRQSCIYGYRQFGVEDQGWIAWFTIGAQFKQPLTIFGDGKQVRDALFIDDLVRAYELAIERIDDVAGEALNVGGGPDFTLSLLELVELVEQLQGHKIDVSFADWRPGDQKVFYCDLAKIERLLGWRPTTKPADGVAKLHAWCRDNRSLLGAVLHLD